MNKKFTLLLFVLTFSIHGFSQTAKESKNNTLLPTEIRGTVLDDENQEPLPYANIIVKHENRGVISNERGDFSLSVSNLKATDSIWIQYIGYTVKKMTAIQLFEQSTVYLSPDVFAMNEVYILRKEDDPKKIVKKVLDNKALNYALKTQKTKAFIRTRYSSDIKNFNINFEKSNIEGLDRATIQSFEESIPKNSISYSDLLTYLYINQNNDDDLELKIDPIKMVALKEEDIAELDKIEKLFDSLLHNTGEKEYWKIKSGIFGQKIDMPEDIEKDTLDEDDTRHIEYLNRSVKYKLKYPSFENKKQWEFLYKTNDYDYTIAGLTHVNNEDAYIIDFTPQKNGKYEGRLYISILTSALIKADYKYAPNKIGKDIHLLGVGFSEIGFAGSIYFEKVNENYELKYFSTKYLTEVSLNRKFSLQKKQSKLLFDKNLNEIKARFIMKASSESSIEYMVVESQPISTSSFNDFKEKEKTKVIYVDQFDENLWKDYPIIEPTQQMKSYKKLNY